MHQSLRPAVPCRRPRKRTRKSLNKHLPDRQHSALGPQGRLSIHWHTGRFQLPQAVTTEGAHAQPAACRPAAFYRTAARSKSTAFSATMMVGALVLPLTMRGMTEASTTRRP